MNLPDAADYDLTDRDDVHWFRHDTQMAVLWHHLYGADEPEYGPHYKPVSAEVGPDRRN